jgi:sodium-dependent dicarboxylate transporter 2/3/5
LLLYIIPAGNVKPIMDWENTAKLPWNIVLLFGGGFALASAFVVSGLSTWFGSLFENISGTPTVVLIAGISTMVTFLTELTSNTATAEMILPIMASLAQAIGENPLLLMVPAALSASCAFMLPVATPPNAIIFGTNRVRIYDMVRIGFIMNIIGVILITTTVLIAGGILGIQSGQLPLWLP